MSFCKISSLMVTNSSREYLSLTYEESQQYSSPSFNFKWDEYSLIFLVINVVGRWNLNLGMLGSSPFCARDVMGGSISEHGRAVFGRRESEDGIFNMQWRHFWDRILTPPHPLCKLVPEYLQFLVWYQQDWSEIYHGIFGICWFVSVGELACIFRLSFHHHPLARIPSHLNLSQFSPISKAAAQKKTMPPTDVGGHYAIGKMIAGSVSDNIPWVWRYDVQFTNVILCGSVLVGCRSRRSSKFYVS